VAHGAAGRVCLQEDGRRRNPLHTATPQRRPQRGFYSSVAWRSSQSHCRNLVGEESKFRHACADWGAIGTSRGRSCQAHSLGVGAGSGSIERERRMALARASTKNAAGWGEIARPDGNRDSFAVPIAVSRIVLSKAPQ